MRVAALKIGIIVTVAVAAATAGAVDLKIPGDGMSCSTEAPIRALDNAAAVPIVAPENCTRLTAGTTLQVSTMKQVGRAISGETTEKRFFITFEPPKETTPATAPAAASPFTFPNKGGIVCDDKETLLAFTTSAIAGKSSSVLASKCEVVPGGFIITATAKTEKDGMIGGEGYSPSLRGGKPFAFLTTMGGATAGAGAQLNSGSRSYKVISPSDVRNTPSKWEGRDIEFRGVHVYWVDDDDVRFVTDTSLTVFAKSVRGDDSQSLRESCERERDIRTAKCRVNIRFRYDDHGEDKPNGYMTRTTIQTSDIEVSRAGATGKKRSR